MQTKLETHGTLRELYFDWMMIGIQSFGGGTSTFTLIHQVAMKRQWLTADEFVRTWALVQISPGINLIKLTTMIGYRLKGWLGIITALSGLLLPSAAITVLMTVGYTTIRDLTWVQAMTKGILPATIGLSLAMGAQMALPQFQHARKQGAVSITAHLAILISAALLLGVAKLSPVLILLMAGVAATIGFALIPASADQK